MIRFIILMLFLAVTVAGCSHQTVHTARVSDTYEIEVYDDGAMAMLNSSRLHQDWADEAKKICPGGYTVVRQEYFREEPFKPARIVGIIRCGEGTMTSGR